MMSKEKIADHEKNNELTEKKDTAEIKTEKKTKNKFLFYTARTVRGISFFVILGILLTVINYALHPKNNKKEFGMKDQNAHAFYAEPENTIDTLIIGNSEAYSSFSPLEMWHEYGITSYVSAQGAIIMSEAYYILKEALKTQDPKIVIFETDALFPHKSDQTLRDRTISNVIENEISLLKYHDTWKIQKPANFFSPIEYKWKSYSRGQMDDPKIEAYGSNFMDISEGKDEEYKDGKINFWILKYLDKFVDLCKENNISVIFVTIPNTLTTSRLNSQAVKDYCSGKSITYLDFSEHPEYINIDWTTDTRDGGVHMNTYGAKKVSDFLGQYITDNYDIPDRRKDEKLAKRWDSDYRRYSNRIQKMEKEMLEENDMP